MSIIEVRGLRKTYGATAAIDGIDLDVKEGVALGGADGGAASLR